MASVAVTEKGVFKDNWANRIVKKCILGRASQMLYLAEVHTHLTHRMKWDRPTIKTEHSKLKEKKIGNKLC